MGEYVKIARVTKTNPGTAIALRKVEIFAGGGL